MCKLILLSVSAAVLCSAADRNGITAAEKKAGWRLLFDGSTLSGWVDPGTKRPPGDSWTIEAKCLKAKRHPRITEDLFTVDTFGDFELQWDWKIAPGGNSGLKYRIQDTVFLDHSKQRKDVKFEQTVGDEMQYHRSSRVALQPGAEAQEYVIGFEYQMIDDGTNKDALRGSKYQSGALYDMIPPSQRLAKPVGQWNHSRIVLRGDHVEHWLNGVKVVDADLNREDVKTNIAARWAPAPQLIKLLTERPHKRCPISLQNHGNEAWFCNIKIRPF